MGNFPWLRTSSIANRMTNHVVIVPPMTSTGIQTFEIQIHENGRWIINAIFDDRQLALFEARRMENNGRFSGRIRVVQEIYFELDNSAQSQTIHSYSGHKGEFRGTAARAPKRSSPRKRKATSGRRAHRIIGLGGRQSGAQRTKATKGALLLTAWMVAGLVVLGAMYGLQHGLALLYGL